MDNKTFSITRYALQSFRYYGGKSIILMIILASTLISALMNITTSLQKTVYEQAVTIGGDAQFKYYDVTSEQIEIVKNQTQVDWTSEYMFLPHLSGTNIIDDGGVIDFIYMENIKQMDGFKIIEGDPPQKENEAAVPSILAEYLGIEAKVGTKFEINLVDSSNIETPMRFIVSGIIQDNSYLERGVKLGNNHIMFVSKEFILANTELTDNESTETVDLYVKLKKGYEARAVASEIAEIIGIEDKDIAFNTNYLYASLNDNSTRMMFYCIIAFFAIVGTIIIYNAFNIVIAKRTRHFGLLTLIGASKKQIKKCVYIEALLNTMVALPIGLLLGTLSSWIVMPIVRTSVDSASTVYSISPWSYLITALITVLMVIAGALIPAKRAGKITAVEAAKFMPNDKKVKKVKNMKDITLKSLARVNLFRKKSGAGGIITSLSIVGALFISLSFVLFSVYGSLETLIKQSMAGDIEINWGVIDGKMTYYYDVNKILPPDIVNKIINLDGVEDSQIFYIQNYAPIDNETIYGLGSIFGADDNVMNEIIQNTYEKEGNLSLSDLKENKINVIAVRGPAYYDENESIKYYVGQDITVTLANYNPTRDHDRQVTLHVAGIVNSEDLSPYGIGAGRIQSLIIPQSSFEANDFELKCYQIFLNIDDSKHEDIALALDEICEDERNIHYESFINLKKSLETQMFSILVLVMAGLGIVFLVSILNLVSTTFIGIEQRKKELGVLSALGMEKKEVKKMLKWEGIWVSVISSAISISGGFALGGLFYMWAESMGANYIDLTFPVIPVIIFCLTYVFTPYIISSIATSKLMKSTTVELIGQEI